MNRPMFFRAVFWACAAWIAAAVSSPDPVRGQPPIKKPFDPISESTTFKLFEQIAAAADEIAQAPDDPHLHEDDFGDDYEPWMDVLQLTRGDNPLITDDCRKQALQRTIEVTGDASLVRGHFEDRRRAWNEVRRGTEKVKLSDYLGHLRKCKRACGPYVAELLDCHVQGVQRQSHMVVYFDVGQPQAGQVEGFSFLAHDEDQLRRFSEKVRADGKSLLVLSRASILHAAESVDGNRQVAGRRADVVESYLIRNGYRPDRIEKRVLAWEPPRLEAFEIADVYGFGNDWTALGKKQYMDQSVVLVAY